MNEEIRLSGIVVCFNEDRHLEECLTKLNFCDELIVIDLGSTDQSVEIAKQKGARIVKHPWVPVVEQVRSFAVQQAKNDWVIFMDPDLIFPQGLERAIKEDIQKYPDIGMINVRYQNYYLGKPLRFGRWGGENWYPAVQNRKRVIYSSDVHRGIKVKQPYISRRAGGKGDVIVHYWVDSKEEFFEKHERYHRMEGKSRYNNNIRTSRVKILIKTGKAILNSAIIKGGFLDGYKGIYLSYLSGWYEWNSEHSLLRYQKQFSR